MCNMTVKIVSMATEPYAGQRPGTSGLRKPTKVFMEGFYTQNFIQSILHSVHSQRTGNEEQSLVLGGDGRYYCREALNIIISMCAANNIARVYVGLNGILSTPALSHIVRKYAATGGIVLTASHNPGGLDNDFGVKYNASNGGPASEVITEQIFENTKTINRFFISENLNADVDTIGEQIFQLENDRIFKVIVLDSVRDYLLHLREIFHFPLIRTMLTGSDGFPPFTVLVDAMHGVMGPYVKAILCDELGLPLHMALNAVPLEDFGGGHPDPNLTYAHELVKKMAANEHDMGVAFDGDGDRNMILGRAAFFVSPCDSVAIIANNLNCIPYFDKEGIQGFARSMPTSAALDRVAMKLNAKCYEVPTGWKYFGNLMDTKQLCLCGEESFGTGSNHVREKDGLWAVLCWLSILATERSANGPNNATVEAIVNNHWTIYGRNFFTRYDYENCSIEQGNAVMEKLRQRIATFRAPLLFETEDKQKLQVDLMDDFCYTDPVDKTVSKNQGIRVIFHDGSRLIFRLSGTGSSGATIRMYIDSYVEDHNRFHDDPQVFLKPMIEVAEMLSGLKEITGHQKPDVIT